MCRTPLTPGSAVRPGGGDGEERFEKETGTVRWSQGDDDWDGSIEGQKEEDDESESVLVSVAVQDSRFSRQEGPEDMSCILCLYN